MGTPASMSARVEPQMEPWEVEPLEESNLGHHADGIGELVHRRGSRASSAFSARLPWPISRREVERLARASPVEKDGKL